METITFDQFEKDNLHFSTFEVEGYAGNGSNRTLETIFYHKGWYIVEGSVIANFTHYPIYTGVDVEYIEDVDACTSREPITSLEQFVEFIDG